MRKLLNVLSIIQFAFLSVLGIFLVLSLSQLILIEVDFYGYKTITQLGTSGPLFVINFLLMIFAIIIPATVVVMTFLSKKHKSLTFFIMLLSISMFGASVLLGVWTSFELQYAKYSFVANYIALGGSAFISLPFMIISIVNFAVVKPFRKNNEVKEKQTINNIANIDGLLKARQLLDSGTISEEEFAIIKSKLI